MKSILMARGAQKLVHVCTRVEPDEQVLVVADSKTDPDIIRALVAAVATARAHPIVMIAPEAKRDSGEPPSCIAQAMKAADVVFTPVTVSITHTEAARAACAAGARIANLTQWTADMMIGGGIDANFEAIEPAVLEVAAVWDRGRSVRVMTAAGTDLTLDITGRLGTPHAKTGIVRPGQFHPIPDIESPVSPVQAEGRIVCDASIPYLGIGIVDAPVVLEVREGNVVSIEGGRAARIVHDSWKAMNDPNVYHVAELGIGMNPCCKLIGVMLEDEGVANTCHIGVGTSITLGGTVRAACHYDFIMFDPTITVDGETLMDRGALTTPLAAAVIPNFPRS